MQNFEALLTSSQDESSEEDGVQFTQLTYQPNYRVESTLRPITGEWQIPDPEEIEKEQRENLVRYLIERIDRVAKLECPQDMKIYYITQDTRDKQLFCQEVRNDEGKYSLGPRMVTVFIEQKEQYIISRDCLCAMQGWENNRTDGNIGFHCSKICNFAWPDDLSISPITVKAENPEANAKTLIKIKGPVLPANQPIETALPSFVRQVKNLMKTTGARQLVL